MVEVDNFGGKPGEEQRAWFMYHPTDLAHVPEDFLYKQREYLGIDHTLEAIKAEWESGGPFDGVMGFSQGSVMTHLLAALRCADDECYRWLHTLQFVVCVAGFPSRICPSLAPTQALHLPSLHISGQADQRVPPPLQSELFECFVDGQFHSHQKGHVVPQRADDIEVLTTFLRRWRVV